MTEQKKEKMEEERAEKLRTLLDSGLHQLYGLWDEIGEEECIRIVTLEIFGEAVNEELALWLCSATSSHIFPTLPLSRIPDSEQMFRFCTKC